MALTVGTGPFSEHPAGRFNFEFSPPGAAMYFEPLPYRVRAIFEGETVVDADGPMLLHETGRLPVFYFAEKDVRSDALEVSETVTTCPHKGQARYWSLRVGERTVPDAFWSYPEPVDSAAWLAGYLALGFDAPDEWFVEDEQLFGHARDPYARIDVLKTTRHVRVSLDGQLLAETRRALALFETGLPTRYYMPAEDVRLELLVPSGSRSRCAYKGSASYWSVKLDGDRVVEDLVWSYPEPAHDALRVRDLLCFFNERVDLEVDGVAAERPQTQWARVDESPTASAQQLRGLMARR